MQQKVTDFEERVNNAINYFQSLQPDTKISPNTEEARLYLSSISTAAVARTILLYIDASTLENIAERGYDIPNTLSLAAVNVMFELASEMNRYPTNSNAINYALNVLNGYLEVEKYKRESIKRIEGEVSKLSIR